jgi:hypothetical protein
MCQNGNISESVSVLLESLEISLMTTGKWLSKDDIELIITLGDEDMNVENKTFQEVVEDLELQA